MFHLRGFFIFPNNFILGFEAQFLRQVGMGKELGALPNKKPTLTAIGTVESPTQRDFPLNLSKPQFHVGFQPSSRISIKGTFFFFFHVYGVFILGVVILRMEYWWVLYVFLHFSYISNCLVLDHEILLILTSFESDNGFLFMFSEFFENLEKVDMNEG